MGGSFPHCKTNRKRQQPGRALTLPPVGSHDPSRVTPTEWLTLFFLVLFFFFVPPKNSANSNIRPAEAAGVKSGTLGGEKKTVRLELRPSNGSRRETTEGAALPSEPWEVNSGEGDSRLRWHFTPAFY